MIKSGIDALRAAQESVLAEDAVYRRGAATTDVRAVVGRTVFRTSNSYGEWVRTETRDFIVAAGILPFEPARGDRIAWNGAEYEVLAPPNEPVWRWSDPQRTAMRIHTKLVGG